MTRRGHEEAFGVLPMFCSFSGYWLNSVCEFFEMCTYMYTFLCMLYFVKKLKKLISKESVMVNS